MAMIGNRWFLTLGELSDASLAGLVEMAFELLDCNYSLYQGIDEKRKAQTDVRINGLNIVYDGLPSTEMIEWGLNPRKYYAGGLVLLDAHNIPQEKIFFEDGACVDMTVSYISEGDSYASTAIKISPRVLKVGDDTITQPWTLNDVSAYHKRAASRFLGKIAQPIGKTDVYMIVNEREYELSCFEMSFSQKVDFKGQPTNEKDGGLVSFSIPQMADDMLRKWMFRSDKLMGGEFQFRRGDQSMPLRVIFNNAYCVNMNTYKQSSRGNIQTSFVLSANELVVNGISLFNGWKL